MVAAVVVVELKTLQEGTTVIEIRISLSLSPSVRPPMLSLLLRASPPLFSVAVVHFAPPLSLSLPLIGRFPPRLPVLPPPDDSLLHEKNQVVVVVVFNLSNGGSGERKARGRQTRRCVALREVFACSTNSPSPLS